MVDLDGDEHDEQVQALLAHAQIHRDTEDAADQAPAIADEYARSGRMRLWGWREGKFVLGVIGIEDEGGGAGIVRDLAVDPSSRGQGVGRLLVAHAQRLFLTLQGDTLAEAAGFYSQCGFSVRPAEPLPDGRAVLRFAWFGLDEASNDSSPGAR